MIPVLVINIQIFNTQPALSTPIPKVLINTLSRCRHGYFTPLIICHFVPVSRLNPGTRIFRGPISQVCTIGTGPRRVLSWREIGCTP